MEQCELIHTIYPNRNDLMSHTSKTQNTQLTAISDVRFVPSYNYFIITLLFTSYFSLMITNWYGYFLCNIDRPVGRAPMIG